jgi:hypothetical protein
VCSFDKHSYISLILFLPLFKPELLFFTGPQSPFKVEGVVSVQRYHICCELNAICSYLYIPKRLLHSIPVSDPRSTKNANTINYSTVFNISLADQHDRVPIALHSSNERKKSIGEKNEKI